MSNEKKKWSILDGIELSDPEEMEEYASKATDAQVKQFFQKSAQSAVDCKNQLMQYLQ